MKIAIALLTVVISPLSAFAAMDFHNSISCKVSFSERNEEDKVKILSIGKVFKENSVETPVSCLGWAGDGKGNWYEVSEKGDIYGVNILNNNYLGRSTLELFKDSELEPEIQTLYSSYEITPTARTYENLPHILGCYIRNPLRYGDVTGDDSVELAVFAQDEYGALNVNIFSPTVKKTIFSGRIATYDARINDRLTLADGEQESASNPLANDPTNGQYLSGIAEANTRMVKGIQKAVVGLSKIYIADVNDDDDQDLIQWRKLYKSRENQDPTKGFEKIRDTYIHYKLINGEYKKQPTEQSVVKAWLEAKNLTWQKGYPSKSECPGQEGKLIPEMHDSLLNDPDVLK